MPRSLSELEVRATSHMHDNASVSIVLGDELLFDIALGSISPSTAFKLVYSKTQCLGCAKAVRWLAVIARDYGFEKADEIRELM